MVSFAAPYTKVNIHLGLIEYKLDYLLGASHFVDYKSVHTQLDPQRWLLNMASNSSIFGGPDGSKKVNFFPIDF